MSVTFNTFKFVWIPRVLAITFIAFFSLFSLDVFGGNAPFLDKLAGFLIHMLPSFIMILVLVVTWNSPVAAGVLFIILGVALIFFYDSYEQPTTFIITLIPILTGLMFLVPSIIRKRTSSPS